MLDLLKNCYNCFLLSLVTYKHVNKHIIYNIPENRAVTWDPSGTLAGPYQNRKTGTLVGP